MKLMFNKNELFGQWFNDNEFPEGFTEKVPQHTGYEWNEELKDWVLKQEIINEIDNEINVDTQE